VMDYGLYYMCVIIGSDEFVKPIIIIQARMGSKRMPGKVMKPILGRPMLWHIVNRIRLVSGIKDVVIATTNLPGDEPIRIFCKESGINFFAGSESDVLDRFYQAAVKYAADPIIRITGDCPLVDPGIVKKLLELYETNRYDHVGVACGAGADALTCGKYPDGLDAECFSFAALQYAWQEAKAMLDREHVTSYIWSNKQLFKCGSLNSKNDYSHYRLTVDYEEDFTLITRIYEALFRKEKAFVFTDVIKYLASNPALSKINNFHNNINTAMKFSNR